MCWSAFTVSARNLCCAGHNSQVCCISWLQHSLLVSISSWRMYAWKHHSSPLSKTKSPKLSGKRKRLEWQQLDLVSGSASVFRTHSQTRTVRQPMCLCRNQRSKKYHRVSSTHSENSLHPAPGEVPEPRGRPIRSDGDSSQAAMPGGPGTQVR